MLARAGAFLTKTGTKMSLSTAATAAVNELVLTQPDDWHHHLRDGAKLDTLVPAASKRFRRCIVMPNLVPPVRTTDDALAYRDRIMAAVPKDGSEASANFQVRLQDMGVQKTLLVATL